MAWRTSSIDRRRRGFGLAEAMMATTVLAIAVVGIAGPLGAASEQARAGAERGAALILARELMEEIVAKPLWDGGTSCHLGPESGETDRSKYDSVDDYNGYSDSTKELKNLSGQTVTYSTPAVYSRNVKVAYRTSPNSASVSSGDFALVTVTVTSPHKQVVQIWRVLTNETLLP
jgi:Tfp pilus assembly protein PilV